MIKLRKKSNIIKANAIFYCGKVNTMSFLKKIADIVSTNTVTITEPTFIKEDSDAENQLTQLKSLYELASGDVKAQIDTDIRYLNQGIIGEKQIAFELMNSHIPMLILHDLNLNFDGLSAQVDYVIILRTSVVVIECKNLFGNIEVNSNGDFIRTIEFNGRYRKEGIYSPITQNQRHLDLIKSARFASAQSFIDRVRLERGFERYYRSIVVLANPKTVVNTKFAKKEVKSQIIKADQLINYLKSVLKDTQGEAMTTKEMYELSDFFMSIHRNSSKDYTSKYKLDASPKTEPEIEKVISAPVPIEDTLLYRALKEYRLEKSREKAIKAYYIYNNAQLEEIIKAMPKTKEELLKVNGFDLKRIHDYGDDILNIVSKYK